MVNFIPFELTLALRSKILRNGLPPEDCVFPTDQVTGAFHLAYFVEDNVATIASFFPSKYGDKTDFGYQLRGMATDTVFVGKGYGSKIIEFAISYIKKTEAQYIWCNARASAVEFYKKLGFELVSDEFEIAGVGPHYEMILNLY